MKKKKTVKKAAPKKALKKKPASPRKIIRRGEPKPYLVINARGRGPGLIVCDHASNRVPTALKALGLKKADLQKHIGWDIGAEDATRHLSKLLDMPAVVATYSRLVLDLNRAPHHKESILEESDSIEIPGNKGMTKKDKDRRLQEIFWPYQKQLARQSARIEKAARRKPFIIAIHSFTPEMAGVKRPWHIAVLWNKQEKIAKKLVANLRRNHPEYLVGENEPYNLKTPSFAGSTVQRHAEAHDRPYVFVEFRQDLVDTKEKAHHWAEVLATALRDVL